MASPGPFQIVENRFPQIAPYLLASRLSLTGLVVLKEVLDQSNVDARLERAAGLSEPEVRQLVMRLRFEGVAPSVAVAPAHEALATAPAAAVAADGVATSTRARVVEEPAPQQALEAMTLWVTPESREALAAVGALLSHAVPSGKTVDVLLHALRAQRKVLERRRHGSPRRKQPKAAAVEVKATAPATADDSTSRRRCGVLSSSVRAAPVRSSARTEGGADRDGGSSITTESHSHAAGRRRRTTSRSTATRTTSFKRRGTLERRMF
jgi:hypothetical protein